VSDAPVAQTRSRHRERLLIGMAASIRERGFAGTTVVDCYLALGDAAGDVVLQAISDGVSLDVPLRERLEGGLDGWFALISADPSLARSFALELHLAGERGIAQLRRTVARTGQLLHDLVEEAREQEPELRPLPVDVAMIIAAGIRELVIEAAEQDPEVRLPEVRAAAIELLRSALTAPAPD
jgi:AcrR family transcriptional regulator